MDEKTKSKPLILAMDEAEKELINTVNRLMNENNLPCYLFEVIVDKIHRQLKEGAQGELLRAKNAVKNTPKTEEGT